MIVITPELVTALILKSSEPLTTQATLVRFLPGVPPHVHFQVKLFVEGPVTNSTRIGRTFQLFV